MSRKEYPHIMNHDDYFDIHGAFRRFLFRSCHPSVLRQYFFSIIDTVAMFHDHVLVFYCCCFICSYATSCLLLSVVTDRRRQYVHNNHVYFIVISPVGTASVFVIIVADNIMLHNNMFHTGMRLLRLVLFWL